MQQSLLSLLASGKHCYTTKKFLKFVLFVSDEKNGSTLSLLTYQDFVFLKCVTMATNISPRCILYGKLS